MTTAGTRRLVSLELAVEGPASAVVAARAGADRIELCAALAVHGVTPSVGAIERTIAVGIPVHVLVRPHAGGFEYDADALEVMRRDVALAVRAGAAGVVVGGVRDGAVDVALVRALKDAAGAATVTFHRAFDTLPRRRAALDTLVDLGVARVLTSGGAAVAATASHRLHRLAAHAGGRIEITAGGGVTAAHVPVLLGAGVDAVHASARSATRGVVAADAVVDPQAAAALREAVDLARTSR